jgi:monoamine oxidase
MDRCDVVIVGAGAAGLAAGKRLREAGKEVTILEARDRIGGRAHTDTETLSAPFDLGCHWIHAPEVNPLARLAEEMGAACDRDLPQLGFYVDGSRLGPRSEAAIRERFERLKAAARETGKAGRDEPASTLIDPTLPEARHLRALFTAKHGVDPERFSTLELGEYTWPTEDWAVRDGYGALLKKMFEEVPVELETPVEGIDWDGGEVRVRTPGGEVAARCALLTVSTGVLAAGSIAFHPRLPEWKMRAVEALPMAHSLKVGVRFDREALGISGPGFLNLLSRSRPPLDVEVWPWGWKGVTCYFDGPPAVELDRSGPGEAEDLALETLVDLAGTSLRARVAATLRTGWTGDPWTRGAFSSALPGLGAPRAELAKPVEGKLFFAGEAASVPFGGDVHGAYLSGLDAAEAILGRGAGGGRAVR